MKIRRHIKDYAVEKLAGKVADKVVEEVKSLVNVKNIHHGTDEGTKYIRQWEEYKKHQNINYPIDLSPLFSCFSESLGIIAKRLVRDFQCTSAH